MKTEREIWFYKFLWSYTPIHWKGWAVLFGFAGFALAGAFGGQALLDELGFNDMDWIPFPVFWLACVPSLVVVAHRHSR